MPSAGNLLDYGIAINFFGNYRQEASVIENLNNRIRTSLQSIVGLFVGGSLAYGFKSFMGSIIDVGKQMEMQFAQIKGVLGDVGKTIEMLNWAKVKGLQTSLSDTEVVDAVVSMTRMGLARNTQERNKNFDALADFTAMYLKPKGFSFADAVDMVSKAGFGNWERLGDNFGIRATTIGTQWQSAKQAKGTTTDATSWEQFTKADVERGDKLVAYLSKAKAGTDQYKQSLVELLGLMSKGGMMATMDTFTGVMSNIMEIPEGFMKSLVGYAQVHGTVFNALVTNMKNLFGVLTQATSDGTTAIGNFFQFATDIGSLFVGDINNMGNSLKSWAERIRNFMLDYQNNLAPIILFLALVKIQIQEIAKSFWEGFKPVFMWFIDMIPVVYTFFGKVLEYLGLSDGSGKDLARTLGQVVGVLAGIMVFKVATSPIFYLLGQARLLVMTLNMAYGRVSGLITLLRTSAQGGFLAQLAMQARALYVGIELFIATSGVAIGTVLGIVAVVAILVIWIGYLIYNWEEVGQKMQGVSDIALTLLAVFMPIVGVPLILAKYWDDFRIIFTNIWTGIKAYINGIYIWFREAIIRPWLNHWTNMWLSIKNVAGGFVDWALQKFPFLSGIFEGIRDIWRDITGFVTKVWEKFTGSNFIQTILDFFKDISKTFSDGGVDFEAKMISKYGNKEEQKGLYEDIGKGAMYQPAPVNNTNYHTPAINVFGVQDPNRLANKLPDAFRQGVNKKSAQGK